MTMTSAASVRLPGAPRPGCDPGHAPGDQVYGLGGLDRICGESGADLIHGSDGDDVLYDGHDSDRLDGDGGLMNMPERPRVGMA